MTPSKLNALCLVGLAGSIACAPPVPDSVQSDFSMARDALSFENFARGFSDSKLDADGMERMFGKESVCVGAGPRCTLSPAARQWMKRANEAMKGGRCEGFAVLAPLFQKGDLTPSDFGASEARGLKLRGNKALQKEIAYWFSTQMVPEVVGERSQTFDAKTVMPFLASMLKKGASEHYRLGIVKMEGSKVLGGHALTPIGYTKGEQDGVYLLSVYDNNIPTEARVLTIDTRRNRWEYEASRNPDEKSTLFFGDDTNGNPLYFAPVRTRVGVLPCRFCQPKQGVELVTSGPAEVTMTDSTTGAVTGVSGGQPVTEGGGQVSPTFTGLESDSPGFIISNPSITGDFSVKVAREADEGSTQRSGVTAFGPRFVVAVDGLSSRTTGADTLAVSSGGTRFAIANSTRSPMEFDTAIQTPSGRTVEVSASLAGGADRVETGIDPMTGDVSVSTAGSSGTEVTVAITTTDPMTGASSSGEVTYTASDTSTLNVTPPAPGVDGGTLTGTVVDDNASMRPVADGCSDGRRTGSESDVDCGGACTARCDLGRSCTSGADCASTLCHETARLCVASTCEDGVVNGRETDVDCGGPTCARCSLGRTCDADADCGAQGCVANRCVSTYVISGSVVGLPSGEQLRLRNNGADELTLSANGGFTFARRVPGAYAVTLSQQPANAVCTVSQATGVATEDVSDVRVTCQRVFTIGGAVTGLPAGSSVTLTNSGGDALTVSADGTFSFATRVTGAFLVEVATQPAGGACTVSNGAGTASGPVTTVQVTCVAGFLLSGSATGLPAQETVVLTSAGVQTTVSGNGAFTLSNRVTGAYQVQITQQPATASCVLTNGSGTATSDVNTLAVTCVPTFSLGGTVTGLPSGRTLEVVEETSGARLTVTGSGPFSFGRRVGGPYSVSAPLVPLDIECTVTNGSGLLTSDVSNIVVMCQQLYSIGGSVSGLGAAFVTLSVSTPFGNEPLVLGNGPFSFSTLTPGAYAVTITSQPVGGSCAVVNGSGVATQDITSVTVTCEMGFFIGGTLSNLPAGDGVTLRQGSTAETRALSSNGPFTFAQRATAYAVSVQTQPQGARCTVSNGSGTASANVSTVLVNCIKSGTLDTGFNGTGFMRYTPSTWHSEWLAGVMNPDGTLVVVGREQNIQFDEEWSVNKINPNGGFDTTFGPSGNGELRINGTAGVQAQQFEENARRIFRLSDGSYLIGGLVRNLTVDMAVAKVTPTGRLDTTWGAALPDGGLRGQVTIDVANRQEYTKDMALMPDGRMVLVGNVGRFNDADIFVTRLLPSGAVDTTFATGGHFLAGTPTVEDMPLAVTLTPTGDIVLAGVSGPDSMLLKLTSAGVPDTSFGPGGMLVVDYAGGLNDRFNAITLTANDELVAAGFAASPSNGNNFLLVRRNLSGALVSSFGTAGVLTIDRASRNDIAFVVRELPGGLLLYAGHSSQFAHVGRVTASGTADVFFGVGGTASFESNFGGGAVINDLVFDAQGRIFGVGNFGITNPDMGICRIHP